MLRQIQPYRSPTTRPMSKKKNCEPCALPLGDAKRESSTPSGNVHPGPTAFAAYSPTELVGFLLLSLEGMVGGVRFCIERGGDGKPLNNKAK